MSDAKAVGRLHVFRRIGGYLHQRYGTPPLLVHRVEGPSGLLAPPDSSVGTFQRAARRYPRLGEAWRLGLMELHDVREGRLHQHPLGFQMVGGPCMIAGKSGRVLAAPFWIKGEHSAALLKRLEALGVPHGEAIKLARGVPELDRTQLQSVSDLLKILSEEAALFAEEWARSERRIDELRRQNRTRYTDIIGRSNTMLELFSLMDRIVRTDSTVYIHGENGTGKELVAREVHRSSRRADETFVVQNCSALNDNLLESELFGHKRGSFTGAVQDKPGLFTVADNGTFFLDEIGEMSPALQVKLLRVLQEGTFFPVGDTVGRKVDVRVICATNRDLAKMVAEGTFREDLFYRINVIAIAIPPLRERRDDIPLLVEFFFRRVVQRLGQPGGRKRLTPDALACIRDHDWPGNVRELENEIERLAVLAGPLVTTIGAELLSPHIRMRPLNVVSNPTEGTSLPDALEQLERSMIYEHLKATRWNKTKAADTLGISRRNLIRKVEKYGFDRRSRDR